MDWSAVITAVFEVALIPFLGLAVKYFGQWIDFKINQWKEKQADERAKKYMDMLGETIKTCVIATNQTYVNTLKEQGKFDAEAQKAAFEKTYQAVLASLSKEATKYLTAAYDDVDALLRERIEEATNANRYQIEA